MANEHHEGRFPLGPALGLLAGAVVLLLLFHLARRPGSSHGTAHASVPADPPVRAPNAHPADSSALSVNPAGSPASPKPSPRVRASSPRESVPTGHSFEVHVSVAGSEPRTKEDGWLTLELPTGRNAGELVERELPFQRGECTLPELDASFRIVGARLASGEPVELLHPSAAWVSPENVGVVWLRMPSTLVRVIDEQGTLLSGARFELAYASSRDERENPWRSGSFSWVESEGYRIEPGVLAARCVGLDVYAPGFVSLQRHFGGSATIDLMRDRNDVVLEAGGADVRVEFDVRWLEGLESPLVGVADPTEEWIPRFTSARRQTQIDHEREYWVGVWFYGVPAGPCRVWLGSDVRRRGRADGTRWVDVTVETHLTAGAENRIALPRLEVTEPPAGRVRIAIQRAPGWIDSPESLPCELDGEGESFLTLAELDGISADGVFRFEDELTVGRWTLRVLGNEASFGVSEEELTEVRLTIPAPAILRCQFAPLGQESPLQNLVLSRTGEPTFREIWLDEGSVLDDGFRQWQIPPGSWCLQRMATNLDSDQELARFQIADGEVFDLHYEIPKPCTVSVTLELDGAPIPFPGRFLRMEHAETAELVHRSESLGGSDRDDLALYLLERRGTWLVRTRNTKELQLESIQASLEFEAGRTLELVGQLQRRY